MRLSSLLQAAIGTAISIFACTYSSACENYSRLVAYGPNMPRDEVEHKLLLDGIEYDCIQQEHLDPSERNGSFTCGKRIDLYVKDFPADEELTFSLYSAPTRRHSIKEVRALLVAQPPSILTYATELSANGHWVDRVRLDLYDLAVISGARSSDCKKKYEEYTFKYKDANGRKADFVFRFFQNMKKDVRLEGVSEGVYLPFQVDRATDEFDFIRFRNGGIDEHAADPWHSEGTYEVLNGRQILYRSKNGAGTAYTLHPKLRF